MKKIGLFFGTFNPIHIGHLAIVNHVVENTDLAEVWLVITPQNPFKVKNNLLDKYQRHEMAFRAIQDYDNLRVSKIEFDLPQPNYTSKTLTILNEKHPNHTFALIMGQDNINSIHKWRNANFLLENYKIIVYPRSYVVTQQLPISATLLDNVPVMNISSSFIRKQIKEGKNVQPLLPHSTWKYLTEMNFYKK